MNGSRFREIRKRLGLSQIQVAYKFGCTQYVISRLECQTRDTVPERYENLLRKLAGQLLPDVQAAPRVTRKPFPLCRRCLCWIGTTGLPCGCPGGRPETNEATYEMGA